MATPYENLLANAARNNLLSSDGLFKQAYYLRPYLKNKGIVDPAVIAAVAAGASDSDYTDPTTVGKADPFWGFHDYWKDDDLSGRNLTQIGGFLTGMPITPFTDYGMGRNPSGTIGSWLGSGLLGSQAQSLGQAVGLTALGGIGGEVIGEKVGEELGYTGQWFDINQPGSTMAKSLGFEAGTPGFDKIVNITTDYISEKEAEGVSRDEIKNEIINFHDELKASEFTGPVEIEERDISSSVSESAPETSPYMQEEPTTVNDFVGMFSGIGDTISEWFGGSSESSVSSDSGESSVGNNSSKQSDYSGVSWDDMTEEEAASWDSF